MSQFGRAHQHSRLYFSSASLGLTLVTLAVYVTTGVVHAGQWTRPNILLMLVMALCTSAVFYRFSLLLSARHTTYMLGRAVARWLQVVLFTSLAYAMVPDVAAGVPRRVLVIWAIASLPLVLLALYAMRRTAARFYASDERRRDVVFLDPGPESLQLAQRLQNSPSLGLPVAGYYGDAQPNANSASIAMPRLGSMEDAVADLRGGEYEVAFISLGVFGHEKWRAAIESLADSTSSIFVVPEARTLANLTVVNNEIAGIPLLTVHETSILGIPRILKRGMDITISGLTLLLLSPIMLIIALTIKLTSPGPILFSQIRYGHSGQAIRVYKFRSMVVHNNEPGSVKQATRDDPRITPIGRLLRRTSLDELPQLLNVLSGEMSLVGPRPHAAEHNELYRKQIRGYMLRHSVKPGITGLAQVKGLRGETDTVEKMQKRVEYDRYYIQNWSISMDLKILFRTALLIIYDKAAY